MKTLLLALVATITVVALGACSHMAPGPDAAQDPTMYGSSTPR